jgi:hypothetical protein
MIEIGVLKAPHIWTSNATKCATSPVGNVYVNDIVAVFEIEKESLIAIFFIVRESRRPARGLDFRLVPEDRRSGSSSSQIALHPVLRTKERRILPDRPLMRRSL